MTPLKFYEQYLNQVRHVVYRAGLEEYMDEAESYFALLAMDDPERPDCRSRTRRDPTTCKLSTWTCQQVLWHLLTIRTADRKREMGFSTSKVHKYYHDDGYKLEMSSEAETIIMMIRHDPEGCRRRFNYANALKKFKHAMYDQGWSKSTVESVINELKEI